MIINVNFEVKDCVNPNLTLEYCQIQMEPYIKKKYTYLIIFYVRNHPKREKIRKDIDNFYDKKIFNYFALITYIFTGKKTHFYMSYQYKTYISTLSQAQRNLKITKFLIPNCY